MSRWMREMWIRNLQLSLARPMRCLDHQVAVLGRHLDLVLPPQEFEAVQEACKRSRVKFGAYYHWYLQKKIMARCVRRLSRSEVRAAMGQMDATNYSTLEGTASQPGGLLVAIPHHGHYIPSIMGMIENLRGGREVLVFYGSPNTHTGNALFDDLHECLYGDMQRDVQVIHDTRNGMARALRGLHNGAAVIIMPDVYKLEKDTYLIPFCGRALNVMLGTATLARKTGAMILPAVSRPFPYTLGFKTVFGPVIKPALALSDTDDALHRDYRTTVLMFRSFENWMRAEIVYWQYARTHYAKKREFPDLDQEAIKAVADMFFDDPRINIDLMHPLHLAEVFD